MKKPLSHIVDYLLLTILVSAAILLILFFNGNQYYQQLTIIGLSVLYIVWGVLHHLKEKTLQARIVLEYVLFALLGCIIVIGLLK
jgi:predicted membrane channel-forming protein YqfA (hemolysin III family)